MGAFIQMDNINEFDRFNQKIVWNKLKQALSWREVIGYSSYPLSNTTGLTAIEDIIVIIDREYGVIAIEVKDFSIKDIDRVGSNSWIIKNGSSRAINPIKQKENCLRNIRMKLNIESSLRKGFKGKYFLILPNISRKQWADRGYQNITKNIDIIFGEEIESDRLFTSLIQYNLTEKDSIMSHKNFIKAKKIIEEEQINKFERYIVLDSIIPQGPQNVNNIACKW